jgi:cytochrome c553
MGRSTCRILFIAFLTLVARTGAPATDAAPPAAAGAPRFETDVRPILESKCFRCHSGKRKKADLDLSSLAGIMKGSESGAVIVPGKADKSTLYEMVHSGKMPPVKNSRLSEAEVATIRRWIDAGGAGWQPAATAGTSPKPAQVTQRDMMPLLLAHCAACHGREHKGGLDVRTRAGMLKGGKSGPALVPGHPEKSLLLKELPTGEKHPLQQLIDVGVRPMTDDSIAKLKEWIARGAPEVPWQPDVATGQPDSMVSDRDREFWAFQPPAATVVAAGWQPAPQGARVRNPIDAFICKKLEEKKATLSAEADRLPLLRRAYFDLIGLPPSFEEIQAFLADVAPDAYERMIDRLLASPRYGERWGRYWLDAAGYADSDGKRNADTIRPFAYRYRDYVIRSFNADKPYDRFLLEQIAGDELADYERGPLIPEIMDNLVATGFLRQVPDGTGASVVNLVPDRLDVMADQMEVLGGVVLGLTLKCARCHSHKYDPIPQRDYYRLLAVFKGALDEYDWLTPDSRSLRVALPEERERWQAHNRVLKDQLEVLRDKLHRLAKLREQTQREKRLAQLAPPLQKDLRNMLATPEAKRDAGQKELARKFAGLLFMSLAELERIDDAFRKAARESQKQTQALNDRLWPEPAIQALWDRGQPSPAFVYRRGDFQTPAQVVGPGVPTVLTNGKTPFNVQPPWPGARQTGRRLALARWLIRPEHPLTARVMVNRIWKHHFGQGIVKTLDNFGHTGARPSHPELLDWLAREFVRQGWSVKAMHRVMMTSSTYRQQSRLGAEERHLEQGDGLLARMPLKRMEAEVLYDSLLYISGRLDSRPYGPADPIEARDDGLVTPVGTAAGWRRAVYVLQRRKTMPTVLENFDLPQMAPNCVQRVNTTVASQALYLLNNSQVYQLAGSFADRITQEAGTEPGRQIERIYWSALGRPPTQEETSAGLDALVQFRSSWVRAGNKPEEAERKALADYCHTIFNFAGFLYID